MYLDDIEDDVIYTLSDVESSFSIPKMKLIKCASLEERKIRLCIPLERYHEVMLINMDELIDPITKSYMNTQLAPQYEKYSNFKKVNKYQIKSAISIIIPLKNCVSYCSDLSLESSLFDEVYIQQSLDNNKNPIIRVITASEYAFQLNLLIPNTKFWCFAIYPLITIPPQNDWEPKKYQISRDDLCIYGFELRRYLSELANVESKKNEVEKVDLPATKKTRDDPFREEMKGAIEALLKEGKDITPRAVMSYLISRAGEKGCVITRVSDEINNKGVFWRNSESKDEFANISTLKSRLTYLRKTNPELFNIDFYK